MTLAAFATAGGFAVTIPDAAVSPPRAGQGEGPRVGSLPTNTAADAILRAAAAVITGEADV